MRIDSRAALTGLLTALLIPTVAACGPGATGATGAPSTSPAAAASLSPSGSPSASVAPSSAPTTPPPTHKATHRAKPRPAATTTSPAPTPTTTPTPVATSKSPVPMTTATAPASHYDYRFPIEGCSASPSSSHHDYPASDIFAARGCHFVAVVAGTVDEVSRVDQWAKGVHNGATRGGLFVSIVGVDGVRYYGSHLEWVMKDIKPGVHVRAGQVLGLVGNTGDAAGIATHVHYGVSWPTGPGKWWIRRGEVWPQKYLYSWENGGNLSPKAEVARVKHELNGDPTCRVDC